MKFIEGKKGTVSLTKLHFRIFCQMFYWKTLSVEPLFSLLVKMNIEADKLFNRLCTGVEGTAKI